jgi:hypothetical protein
MEAELFLVGYDRNTGFAAAVHAVPAADADRARSVARLALGMEGDWPLSGSEACQIADLIGVQLDAGVLEFCLEPHQACETAAAPGRKAEPAVNPK